MPNLYGLGDAYQRIAEVCRSSTLLSIKPGSKPIVDIAWFFGACAYDRTASGLLYTYMFFARLLTSVHRLYEMELDHLGRG